MAQREVGKLRNFRSLAPKSKSKESEETNRPKEGSSWPGPLSLSDYIFNFFKIKIMFLEFGNLDFNSFLAETILIFQAGDFLFFLSFFFSFFNGLS